MLTDPQRLLERLEAIGASLSTRSSARALIGLGSVGLERERLDRFSDLDFFVIVDAGCKVAYLDDLDWLTTIAPVIFCFRNTTDGYKLLYVDGVFCEFAVFEQSELQHVPFAPGRIVWKADDVDAALAVPPAPTPHPDDPSTEWLLGEALTNLYVGLLREHRGERLAALRLIQGHAAERLLQLLERVDATAIPVDRFGVERRFEQRHPRLAPSLPALLQGYEENRASARAILGLLEERFKIDDAMKRAILALFEPGAATPRDPTGA